MNIFIVFLFVGLCFGATHEINSGEKITVKSGDVIKLKGSDFSVTVGGPNEPVKCAVPGKNCGAGYVPPHPTFDIKCAQTPCPYIFAPEIKDGTTADVVIHTEESCGAKKHQANGCFYSYARSLKSVDGCSTLKTALGKYHCVMAFDNATPVEHKGICGQLPADIFGLKGSCYYEWAIRYNDPSFCKMYEPKDFNGSERCWLKMAERMKDKSLCKNISQLKSYVELCAELK